MTRGTRTAPRHFVGVSVEDHRPVFTRERCNLAAFGPSQCGKTASILSHAVLNTSGLVVTASTKSDLLSLPIQGRGGNYLLDLIGRASPPDGVQRVGFTPLVLIRTFEDALLVGRTLMDSAYSYESGGGGVTNEAYWTQRAGRRLAAVLWAAHRGGRSIADVFRWATTQDGAQPSSLLPADDQRQEPGDRAARAILSDVGTSEASNTVWSFVEQAIALYAYPTAATLASPGSVPRVDVEQLARTPGTLHIVCPSQWARELGPVAALFVGALADARYRIASGEDSSEAPRLTLVLDEVANTVPLPSLPALCSEGAGQGVSVLLGTQDRAQLETRWGEAQTRTIVNNCRDKVILGEIGDRPMLEDVAALAGVHEVDRFSRSITQSDRGKVVAENVSSEEQPQWPSWAVAQLARFHGLYLRGWSPSVVRLISSDGAPDWTRFKEGNGCR